MGIGGRREVGRDRILGGSGGTGIVHTPREIGGGGRKSGRSTDRTGFQERLPAAPSTSRGSRHRDSGGFTAGVFDGGGGDRSSRSSIGSRRSSGSDTLATSNTVVGIDSAQRDGMRMMVSIVVGMGERT